MTITQKPGTGTGTTSTPGAVSNPPPPGIPETPSGKHRNEHVTQGHRRLLTRRDRLTLGLMAGIPTFLHIALVWVTALASIALVFTTRDGIGFDSISAGRDGGTNLDQEQETPDR